MNYRGLNYSLSEARCDWITCTAQGGARTNELLRFAAMWQDEEVHLGYEPKPYRMQGYRGFMAGRVRWGFGAQGGLVVVSGDVAAETVFSLATLADHWSRVDLCVTVANCPPSFDPVGHYFMEMRKHASKPLGYPQCKALIEVWGGSTFTLGDRQSAYYTRVYDKAAESKGDYPPGSWRYECEMKRHAAEGMHSRAKDQTLSPSFIAAFLAVELERVGLTVPWRKEVVVRRDPQIRQTTDVDRKLKWLKEAVQPSVEWLQEEVGTDTVLRALELPHVDYVYRGGEITAKPEVYENAKLHNGS